MRLTFALILSLSLFKSIAVCAQSQPAADTKVVFDPLFWKSELRLSAVQYNEIRGINDEYYSDIMKAVSENSGNAAALREATEQLLQERSDRIWNTFHPRQKRKWMEISSAYANPTLALSVERKIKVRG